MLKRTTLVLAKGEAETLSNDGKLIFHRKIMPPFGTQDLWELKLIRAKKGVDRIEGRLLDQSILTRPSLKSWGIVNALASGKLFSVTVQCPYSDSTCVIKEPFMLSNRESGIWGDAITVVYSCGTPECRIIEDVPKEELDHFSGKMGRFLIPPSMTSWMTRFKVECSLIKATRIKDEWVWELSATVSRRFEKLGLTKADTCGIICSS